MNVPVMAYVQESIAPEMMGKVFSLLMTAMTLAMPIGLLVAGPVVGRRCEYMVFLVGCCVDGRRYSLPPSDKAL